MATLFIPTRNRPASLLGILRYYATLYPDVPILIADGSTEEYVEQNIATVKGIPNARVITYKLYPSDFPLYDRVLDALNSIDDEYVVWGADDDFLNIDCMLEGEAFLRTHPDYCLAMGYRVKLNFKTQDKLTAALWPVYPLEDDQPSARMMYYSRWHYANTYAVTLKSHVIGRCKKFHNSEILETGLGDLLPGLYDCMCGKIHIVDDISCFSTSNPVHAYIRANDRLYFLRQADKFLRVVEDVALDLVNVCGKTQEVAKDYSERMILSRIRELTGYRFHKLKGFEDSRAGNDPLLKRQLVLFKRLFTPGTVEREKYAPTLRFIAEVVRSVMRSGDNKHDTTGWDNI